MYTVAYPFQVGFEEDRAFSRLQEFLVEDGVVVDGTVSVGGVRLIEFSFCVRFD